MLKLSLFRHAKSSWEDPDLDDHERPLAPRGTKAALKMAGIIRERDLVPEKIICSDAVRTRATLTLLLSRLAKPHPEITITPDLYLAAPDQMLACLAEHADGASHIMLIGHNPGMHALTLSLSGTGRRKDLVALALKFPTAALAHLTFEASQWPDLAPASGRLEAYITPRGLDCRLSAKIRSIESSAFSELTGGKQHALETGRS